MKNKSKMPSGEGERRAMRGFVPQYDYAARAIYVCMANGTLQWVGLADRRAGRLDDLVLGLTDRVIGHQIKASAKPEKFSIDTLLLGSGRLISSLAADWKKLRETHGGAVELRYVCDDFPADDDSIAEEGGVRWSSAAFLRNFHAHRLNWTLAQWFSSPLQDFVRKLLNASGLEEAEFEPFWKGTVFVTSGEGRTQGDFHRSPYDQGRIATVAALLPLLVADPADKDQWTVDEIRDRLKWRDPFAARHGHVFPIDALVQSNPETQQKLQSALSAASSGYVALVGPPGCGKSTLLQSGLLPTPSAAVVRYLAYVPNEGQGLGRGEAVDFLHDLVAQLKKSGLGHSLTTGTTLDELRAQLTGLFKEANKKFEASGVRTIIVIDGLDHVPREERPDRSLLKELPPPIAIPAGVLILLGTQRLDFADIPPAVCRQAEEATRLVKVTPLARDAVHRLADLSGVPYDCDRDLIYERAQGHPLSTRYVVGALLALRSEEERKDWLRNGPVYGGDVEEFYRRAWHDLENDAKAREVLSYVALIEGSVHRASLDELLGPEAVDRAWQSAQHLLSRSVDERWRIFHNSFRLFILEKTKTRHGLPSPDANKARYAKLADMAQKAATSDEQRWLELRYKARAEDHAGVLALCYPDRFRQQFLDGRNPRDIFDDIKFGFTAVSDQKSSSRLFELVLARQEIEMRTEAMGVDELIDAYIATGQLDQAIGLLDYDGASFTVDKPYEVVDALLLAGRPEEARRLFEAREPLDELLGARPVDGHSEDEELHEWARRAPIFRAPSDVLASIERLCAVDRGFPGEQDIGRLKRSLRFSAARWELERDSSLEVVHVAARYQIPDEEIPFLLFVAARAAYFEENSELAVQRFSELSANSIFLGDEDARRIASLICLKLQQKRLAQTFFEDVSQPTIERDDAINKKVLERDCAAVFDHATLEAALDRQIENTGSLDANLLQGLQAWMERLGRLNGLALSGRQQSIDTVLQEVKKCLTFLARASSKNYGYDSDRWRINNALSFAARAIVKTAAANGSTVLDRIAEHIDEQLTHDDVHIRNPAFRRAFALEAFRYQRDRDLALNRLVWEGALEGQRTPHDYIREASEQAIGLVRLGEPERARHLLAGIHAQGLGYSRAPKKDPQYAMWRDLFERACEVDQSGVACRSAFFLRLVCGLAKTEGSAAAARLTPELIRWTVYAGPQALNLTLDKLEAARLTSWAEIVTNVTMGVAKRWPDYAALSIVAFGRLGIPFIKDADDEAVPLALGLTNPKEIGSASGHLIACINTDGHEGARASYLSQVVGCLEGIASDLAKEALARWQREDEPLRRRSSDDDEYASVVSMDDLLTHVIEPGKQKSTWAIARAIKRLSGKASLAQFVQLFQSRPDTFDEERILTEATKVALREGASDIAKEWLETLRTGSSESGSWGGYQSGSKTRHYAVRTALEGDKAREAAFHELAFDLSRGREWMVSLLPDLGDVLALTKPRLTFSEMFEVLKPHLTEFREFKAAEEVIFEVDDVSDGKAVLVELLMRAFDLRLTALNERARLAVKEMTTFRGGIEVTIATIDALWKKGGDASLEAIRIIWECRDVEGLRKAFGEKLQAWSSHPDLAIQRTVAALSKHWDIEVEDRQQQMPPFYALALPDTVVSEDFDEPLGFTPEREGLWADDPYAWTWWLKRQLKLLSDFTGFSVGTLRRRTAQFMAQQGGREAFGPEVTERQQQRMSRLDLRTSFQRPMAYSALRAARQVGGELLLARRLRHRDANFYLREVGGFNLTTDTTAPHTRPEGCVKLNIPESFGSVSAAQWAAATSDEDLALDHVRDWVCLATVSRFERTRFHEVTRVERLVVPSRTGGEVQSLSDAMAQLKRALVVGSCINLYDDQAEGGVITLADDPAGSFPDYGLTLCPHAAAAANVFADQNDPFTWRNGNGLIVARTIWWREGGIRADDVDDGLRGEGSLLLVTPEMKAKLAQHTGTEIRVSAWRSHEDRREGVKAQSTNHRLIDPT